MNRAILTFVLLSTTIISFSQEFLLDIHKNKLSDFVAFEQNLGSKRLENSSNYISQQGVAQPIQFRREQKGLPDLFAYYFFYQKDSTINYVLYEWDDNNSNGHKPIPKKSFEEIKLFIDKYKELHSLLYAAYGKSKTNGDLNDLSKIETGDFRKEDTWDMVDSSKIELSIVLSNKYEKNGAVTISRTYRIRLYITDISEKTNENKVIKPDEAKIKELDLLFKTFLTALKNKNFEQAKLNLSSSVANQVTVEQLENLRENLKFYDSPIIYLTGMQMGFDGSNYLMVQYKYKSDFNDPPKDLIKVIFDDKNKIIGVQPTKRP